MNAQAREPYIDCDQGWVTLAKSGESHPRPCKYYSSPESHIYFTIKIF